MEINDRPGADLKMCHKRGHQDGCPCGAGGDEELRPFTDNEKWDLGLEIFEVGLSQESAIWDQAAVSQWLEEQSIESHFAVNEDGQFMEVHLWRHGPPTAEEPWGNIMDDFMLEYAGHDAATMSLFSKIKEGDIG